MEDIKIKNKIIFSVIVGVILTAGSLAIANPPGWRITQLTDNSNDEYDPRISGSNVVWYGYDGNDYEIFLYDGTTISQLTDNNYDDWLLQISGSNIVWMGYDGSDYEIFIAEKVCEYNLVGDLNNDCKVNFIDFASMASNWLVDCFAEPSNPACVQ